MLPHWYLGLILTGLWVLIGIMAYMLYTNSQERKRQKQHDAEQALARELEEFRARHNEAPPPPRENAPDQSQSGETK